MKASDTRWADEYADTCLRTAPNKAVEAYRSTYGIPAEIALTPEMVALHWRVERDGRAAMLESEPSGRLEAGARAYDDLRRACTWFKAYDASPPLGETAFLYAPFDRLVGNARSVFEVGSGNGDLITFLARKGRRCVGSEPSVEPEGKYAPEANSLEWHRANGVDLERSEPGASYDVVISNQVVEHMHPNDLETHSRSVLAILKPGGRYILATPHVYLGPADLSQVFGLKQAVCHHLKEYRYWELARVLTQAGFVRLEAFYVVPKPIRKLLGAPGLVWSGSAYLRLLIGCEKLLDSLPAGLRGWIIKPLFLTQLWRQDVCIVAVKA
jgi:2-polyprenyl-3-methyl-5-hydroxy-6-metoxy-1,4-benzoquinol methylase